MELKEERSRRAAAETAADAKQAATKRSVAQRQRAAVDSAMKRLEEEYRSQLKVVVAVKEECRAEVAACRQQLAAAQGELTCTRDERDRLQRRCEHLEEAALALNTRDEDRVILLQRRVEERAEEVAALREQLRQAEVDVRRSAEQCDAEVALVRAKHRERLGQLAVAHRQQLDEVQELTRRRVLVLEEDVRRLRTELADAEKRADKSLKLLHRIDAGFVAATRPTSPFPLSP